MSKPPDLGLDTGSLVTRVALGRRGHEPLVTSRESGPAGRTATLADALRARDCGRVCVAVPDSWLDGELAGALEHEAMRAVIESERPVSWVGQMAAVAATRTGQGVYLVCDAGGAGIRAGLFTIANHTVRLLRSYEAPGGGCADFDAAIRTVLGSEALPPPAQWFAAAATQNNRAMTLLRMAATDKGIRAAPLYERAGLTPALTAGLLLDSFQPTAERIRSAITAVLTGATPVATLLVGGLAWFPLVSDVISGIVAAPPDNLGAEAAAKGALAFASGQAELAPVSYPEVGLPAHEIRAGLLTETLLPLRPGNGAVALTLDSDDLVVDVAGAIRTVHVPGVVPGPYRICIRPGGTSRALLVLRPASGDDVLIGPLDLE